jgi:hypothetical protein
MKICTIRSDAHPELCLDIEKSKGNGMVRGCRVIVNNDNGQSSQQWEYDPKQHSIISVYSHMAIDIGSRSGPRRGSDIIMWEWRSSSNQMWTYDFDSKSIICHPHDLVMDIGGARFNNGANVCAWTMNYKPQQRWRIVDIQGNPFESPQVSPSSAVQVSIAPNDARCKVQLIVEFPRGNELPSIADLKRQGPN